MGKQQDIQELTNLMTKALRHRIGAIVNQNEFYARQYAKDAEILMKEAEKALLRQNWNKTDKLDIQKQLHKKLHKELEQKAFLDDKKFVIMDTEMEKALRAFDLH